MANPEIFPRIETINLFRNSIGDAGALILSRSKPFINLKAIYLGENNISDIGAVALIKSNSFPMLGVLDMVKNNLGLETSKAIFTRSKDRNVQIIIR